MAKRRPTRNTPRERVGAGEGEASPLSAEQEEAFNRPLPADERRRLITKNAATPRALVNAAIDALEEHGVRLGPRGSARETRGVLAFADACTAEAQKLKIRARELDDAGLRAMTLVNETARHVLRRARSIVELEAPSAELVASYEAMAATTRKFGRRAGMEREIAAAERVARAEARVDAVRAKERKAAAAVARAKGKKRGG